MPVVNRRDMLRALSMAAPAFALGESGKPLRIALEETSVRRAIAGLKMTHLDFPRYAREAGIEGLEFANTLWGAPTQGYMARLKTAMKQTGTRCVLILCDDEGPMGHSSKEVRRKAVDNHRKWVDYCAELGGQSIRANMHSDVTPKTPGEREAVLDYCAESFAALSEYARGAGLNVLVENDWGLASDADAIVALIKKVNQPNFGTLPDFGNFPRAAERYEAVRKMMPYAKGVSFKCYDFSPEGKETTIDMERMMKIVVDAGYRGFVGIEYAGHRLSEHEGVKAGKRFLDQYAA
ncbi:MAG: sugar phosphate isomerase/epimerase family protein [Bryobacteraceae bacterium]